MPFAPTEFTQVNAAINRVLVRRAMALLDPQPGERVADFFCGLGNFTLPIARRGAQRRRRRGQRSAGRARAGQRAAQRARGAQRASRRQSVRRSTRRGVAALRPLDRALIDPPREGAIELVKALPGRDAERRPDADRLRVVQSGDARARRGRAGARARLSARRPRASSTCSRTPRTSNRSRCSSRGIRPPSRPSTRRPRRWPSASS